MGLLHRAVALTRAVFGTLACLCLAFMLVAVLVQVAGRYFFHYQISGASELALFAQAWLGFFGFGVAMRYGTVFAIDALAARLPLKLARALSLAMVAAALAFLGVVIHGSLALIDRGAFQTSSTLLIPMWIIYAPFPLGIAYLALETVLRAADRWADPFQV